MLRTLVPRLGLSCVIGIVIGGLSGCGEGQSHGGAKAPDAAVKVVVATPVEEPVTDFMEYTGRTEAVESVEIRPRVSGYLTKVEYMGSLDSEVTAGDLLFEIDDRPYKIALASAKARVASAKAGLTTSTAELNRTEGLFNKNVVVQAELDRDIGRKAQSDADILSSEAGVNQALLDLEFTSIKAPISGMISKPSLTVGNLVSPATQTLTSIVSVDPIYVYFDLDEPTMLQIQQNIREGKLATREEGEYKILLGLANDKGHPYTGKLDFIDNRVDPNTGTIRVRGVFANPKPKRGSRPLTPGLFARVRVPLGEARSSLLITERAIGRDRGKTFVYVIGKDKTVQRRSVRLGAMHDGLRVVRPPEPDQNIDGILAGDQVVISGLQRIRPGVKVEPIVKAMAGKDER